MAMALGDKVMVEKGSGWGVEVEGLSSLAMALEEWVMVERVRGRRLRAWVAWRWRRG